VPRLYIEGGVFKSTSFQKLMENCSLNISDKSVLPGRNKLSPYVFVADDAFPLSSSILNLIVDIRIRVQKIEYLITTLVVPEES